MGEEAGTRQAKREVRHPEALGRIALFSVILSILGRCLGYVRTLIVAYFFGVTPLMDAFSIAMGITEFFAATIRSSLQMALLPQLSVAQLRGGEEETRPLMGFISRIVLVLAVFFLFFSLLFPVQVVRMFAYGFTGPVLQLSALTLRLLSFYLVGYTGYCLYSVWAFHNRRYLLPSVLEATLNILTVIFFMLIMTLSKSKALPLSVGLAWCILLLSMAFLQRDFPWNASQYMPHHFKKFSKNFIFCLGLVGSGALYQATDRFFASLLQGGSVAVLNYSIFLLWVPLALLEPAFQIFFADIVHLHYDGPERARLRIYEAISLAFFYGIPLSMFFLLFSPSAVKALFGYGAFDSNAVSNTAACLAAYGAGFAFTAGNHLLWRYGHAAGRSGELLLIAYLSVLANAVLDWGLSRIFGVAGIAIATTIVTSFTFCLFILRFMGKEYFIPLLRRAGLFLILSMPWFFLAGLLWLSSPILKFISGILASFAAFFFSEYWLGKWEINLEGTPTLLLKMLRRK